jgi:hypothetical protein
MPAAEERAVPPPLPACYTEASRVRIPFPERVPLDRVAIFAAVLFAVQRFEGTTLYFSAGCVVFILIAALAFNIGGGLTRTPGAYVFFYSLLVVIIGLCYKAYLGEPADSNLLDPRTDIKVYVGGITTMLAAVIVSRRFARRTGLLQNILTESRMYRASVGCMVFGVAGGFIIALMGEAGTRLISAFIQLNQLIPLGIIIGVIYEIRSSRGTRSINLPLVLAIAYVFSFYGLLGFSKQGMLLPLVCWALPVCAMQYRLSRVQVLGCLLGVVLIFRYLVPYSQYGRNFLDEDMTFDQQIAISVRLLKHPDDTRKKYLEATEGGPGGYYNKPQGFWDRLNFVSVDDSLVNITDQGKVFGLWPVKACLLNMVPHVFWPNKPDLKFGNTYAHEMGHLSEEDTTTGISFSATAEAYHWARWFGVLFVAPLIWLLVFLVYDFFFGDLRATPWGLLVLAVLSHTASEGMLSGLFYFISYALEALIFCAVFATYIAPLFAIAVLGPDRRLAARPTTFDPADGPGQDRLRLWPADPPTAHGS